MVDKASVKEHMLGYLESLAKAWAAGDTHQAQYDYEYIRLLCENENLDFNNALVGGMKHLLNQCVGVKDSMIYSGYLNGIDSGFGGMPSTSGKVSLQIKKAHLSAALLFVDPKTLPSWGHEFTKGVYISRYGVSAYSSRAHINISAFNLSAKFMKNQNEAIALPTECVEALLKQSGDTCELLVKVPYGDKIATVFVDGQSFPTLDASCFLRLSTTWDSRGYSGGINLSEMPEKQALMSSAMGALGGDFKLLNCNVALTLGAQNLSYHASHNGDFLQVVTFAERDYGLFPKEMPSLQVDVRVPEYVPAYASPPFRHYAGIQAQVMVNTAGIQEQILLDKGITAEVMNLFISSLSAVRRNDALFVFGNQDLEKFRVEIKNLTRKYPDNEFKVKVMVYGENNWHRETNYIIKNDHCRQRETADVDWLEFDAQRMRIFGGGGAPEAKALGYDKPIAEVLRATEQELYEKFGHEDVIFVPGAKVPSLGPDVYEFARMERSIPAGRELADPENLLSPYRFVENKHTALELACVQSINVALENEDSNVERN